MRVTLITALLLVIAGADALAQDDASLTPHERAAAELIDVLQLEKIAMTTVDVMAQAMADQNPMSAELTNVMAAFTKEFMRWEDLRPEYIRMYCDAYTEAELMELIAFYKTPVGRKTIEITPQLMRQATELRQEQLQQHLPELQRRIRVRMRSETDTVKQRDGS